MHNKAATTAANTAEATMHESMHQNTTPEKQAQTLKLNFS